MNEIRYRAVRAKAVRRGFTKLGTYNQSDWCLLLGLWETSGYVPSSVDGYKMLKWVKPGQTRFDE